ncbi:MAG: peptidoglycan-binding protein [Candidatus Thermofonsia Clade 3 bacterium]|uniref:Peptidoglycan-binding protein n=2 Tax=Candidatus Thermofonsia Clade 3 TaxID=2364209 RepID=A0A2M8QAU2_9CHLR|nr:MAG: peptidoglycan-binding protein [Candidatus Thermofonsia Clade 3 bacterium]
MRTRQQKEFIMRTSSAERALNVNTNSERMKNLMQAGYVPVKAMIVSVDPPFITIPCQFNPSEIRFSKGTRWSDSTEEAGNNAPTLAKRNVPKSYFKHGEAPRLKMSLFFDTSEVGHMDVRHYTDLLVALTVINPTTKASGEERPSLVKFIWGMFSASLTMSFTGYIPSVDLTFSLFLPDGTPVRAEAEIELVAVSSMLPFQNPTSRSEARQMWVVTEGQTLDWIAYQAYGDPSHWRHIAEANGLLDPRNLKPGQVLKLTPLPPPGL